MAINLLPLAKLAMMAGKTAAPKGAAALTKHAAALATRGQVPGWLVKGVLAGLLGFKLLFLLVLAHQRNLFKRPDPVGCTCSHCGHCIDLTNLSRSFRARLTDREFVFSGQCPACAEILGIRDSSLKNRPR